MYNFIKIINNHVEHVTNINDKRIMKEAINIIESEEVILDDELNILNEVFISLKEDYTIKIIQDPTNLDFCLAITKQPEPIIKNQHELNSLVTELKRYSLSKPITKIESVALNFLDAS